MQTTFPNAKSHARKKPLHAGYWQCCTTTLYRPAVRAIMCFLDRLANEHVIKVKDEINITK